MIEIFIPGVPPTATAQQKGQNRRTGAYYKPQNLKEAEAWYMAGLSRDIPKEPLTGPLVLRVMFGWKATKAHPGGTPKTSRPDTDNAVKLLKDCLTKLRYWGDDAQVALELVSKLWADNPGVMVQINTWDEEEKEYGTAEAETV